CTSPSQVFSLDGQQLLGAKSIQVDCVPAGATVILNISGTQAGLDKIILDSLTPYQSTTLFNFYQAQTLTLTGVTVRGTVLAPHADVAQAQGALHGTAITRSWSGPMKLKHVPFRGAGEGDFCPLYPIALPYDLLVSATPGTQFLQVPRGTGPGQFSWLTWAGSPNAPTLARSLTPPGDSYTYINPYDSTDWLVSPHDWVKGAAGNMNSAAVRARLDALIGQEIAVPAWSKVNAQNTGFEYEAEAFVRVRLLAYQLTGNAGKTWLSFEYLGFTSCYNRPPTVDAGPDQAIALPPGVATLAGTVEDDGLPNGTLEILWTTVSGPGAVTFADPQSAATTATFTVAGEYVLRLTANDGELGASDEMRVVVSDETNEAPVVDAGPDQQITLPVDTVTLQGTATDDGLPQGSSLSVLWTQLSGPAPVEFATPTSAVTSARFTAAGTYVLQLSATDGQLSATDTTTVVVRPLNQPPTVQAGPDQTIVLPDDAVDLAGVVADDGLPNGTLAVSWTQASGPAGVTFASASSAVTTAHFPGSGTYVLRLTADDGAATASDELTVTVEPPIPVISITGATVTEGHQGTAAATLEVHLSVPTERIVSVDYGTLDGTAGGCDYAPRAGTLTFAAGEVLKTVVVPVTGDLAVEGNETFTARLAQPVQGTLGADQATVTIVDDDQDNQPPAAPAERQPADRSLGVVASPTLSWSASDPDPGDALAYDVFLGTAFDLAGQSWSRTCPSGAAPSARRAAASAYDADGDRLMVLGGANGPGASLSDLWILDDASGAGRVPSWRARATGAGPSARQSASLVLDPASGRAVLFGGCGDACETARADAWVLVDALGTGGPAVWQALPDAPAPRSGHAAAFVPGSGRMIVFGGSDAAGGPDSSDVWVLENATTPGSAQWQVIAVGGAVPPARRDAAVAYDAEGDRLFVVGGRTAGGAVLGDAWVLRNASGATGAPEWVALDVQGTGPAARSGAALAYDAPSDRLLLTGGASVELGGDPAYAFDDLWILTGPGGATPAWSLVSPSDRPAGRYQAAAGYSPANARLVLALGGSPQSPEGFDDAWRLSNPFGSLPLVSAGQSGATFAAGPLPDDVLHFWRVVARDPKGAFHGSTVFRFTPGSPLIDVAPASAPEGNAGTSPMTFALTLSAPRGTDVVVSWTTGDGSAVAGEDYVSATGTVTFAPGATSATVGVDVIGDRYPESDETLALVLSAPVGAAIRNGDAVGTILDDDTPNDPPVVSAGPDQVVPVGPATLDGTVTDDGRPLPPALSVLWTQVSGPAPATFADAGSVDTSVTLPAAGIYVLRLTASDGELSRSDDVTIEALAGNEPPVVSAGPDQTVLAPVTVASLAGFASDDGLPEGSTLTVAWSLVSGPGSVTFGNAAAAATTVTLSAPGAYVLRLTASDGALSASDDVTVTLVLANAPPIVSAGPDQFVFLPNVQASLPGIATDDGLPQPLVSTWSVESGPPGVVFANASSPVTTATFPGAGVYVVRLLATDGEEDVFDEATITVAPAPDIVVDRVDAAGASVDGQTLAVSGSVDVMLRNASTTATGPFSVTLFEDRNQDGAYQPGNDELLGVAEHPGLAGGATATLTAPVEGTLLFVGNLVWAFADSGQAVVESNETNNYGSSAPPCQLPPPAPFAPVQEWAWTSTSVVPTYTNVMSTPMAADLDLDGVPEVVFASYPGGNYGGLGILRALRGNSGSEMWSATASGSEVNAVGNVAIGNLDADPFPEIVSFQGGRPIIFEHDGTRKLLGASGFSPNWGGPSLADLDGDGIVEIIAGRQVFNADGTIRWTGAGTNGDAGNGPLSIVADLDMDGSPEVVAGPTAYRANGTIWWRNTTLTDGWTAVGNFDSDPFPEIVLTGGGRVTLLEHDGTIKWGPISHPGGGVPGAPTVADFDGDGAPEIGVAGANRYTVFETNGTVRWSAVTQDGSSARTGSSVFDFEGDGRAEVVYRDETRLWVFRGTDGAVLFSTPLHSCTTFEYPIILDVDGDGNAEIVSPANDTCGFGPTTGIHVFGDSADRWVGTRPIWNQHQYHITNIAEDLTIPRHEDPSWLLYNSYRQNILTGGCPSAQPDVTASYVRIGRQGAQVSLTARIGNAGVPVGGVHTSFYDGDPRTGGRLLGTVLTSGSLARGGFQDVTLLVSAAESAYPVWVVADDRGGLQGALTESNETNNFYESPFDLVPTPNEPPVVNAGPDQTAVVGPVALAGQVTDDGLPSGTLVSVWTVASGPAPVSFADDSQPATTATFTQAGTYVLRLTASDGDLTGQDEVTITVTAGNQPPSVDAGPDQAATLPTNTVTLQGQVSDDGLPGGPLAIGWSQVSGPASVVFASPSTAVTQVTATVIGTYVLRLTANDGALSGSDDVAVRVGDATSLADLVVPSVDASGLQVDDQTFALSGSAVVTVRNVGLATAAGPFTLTVFEDRDFDGVFGPADGVLGSADLSDLAPGASPVLSLPLSGTLLFRGNLVHAFVDSGAAVAESDETNNYGNSAPPCPDEPPSSLPFQPTVKWAWTGAGSPVPTANQVESAPVVVDLDLDGLPEVLTVTWGPGSSQAYLRALSGRDGSHVFTVQDPARRLYWASHLAVGNLDADPNPEIVAVATADNRLYAFEHDGTFKWESPLLEAIGYGGPALADLDGDGTSEIVIGKQVLNANGTLRWTGTGGRTDAYAQLSLVADLDMDGTPEVVAGSTAYRANGSIYWRVTTIPDGFNAIGNFDADPFPEIVVVAAGQVRLLEHTGAVKWGPVPIPGGGSGGPPTVADFDGDGQPEIGVAGSTRYAVFETNGSVKWQSTTQDGSSNRTGSSVFDFEGDGSAEVVYADEVNLRVYRGSDGTILFETRMGSSTAVEYPIVADVDADGHAEIVAVGSAATPGRTGLYVFGDGHDRWVATRRIWNQHTYHVDNVRDDATIPAHEVASWSTHNTYRQNLQPGGCLSALPDLVAGHLRVTAGSERLLAARVGNAGNNLAPPMPVAFYDGEPFQGGTLLGTTDTTVSLAP
ncbi:MAG TPA: FG-GAP-like repeat-containing protein, partial [Vicinamibacteria bacterium]|nr:FG-GAP-like repeat-containing protein [Vicinamibacteria bacterium]